MFIPFKHGESCNPRTKEYRAWGHMIDRCTNPKNAEWPRYGGRGITVCDRWRDYPLFLADVGRCPAGHSLDRRDTNGNYEPSNVRWATPGQQTLNSRRCRYWTLDGERIGLAEMERHLAMPPQALGWRLRRLERSL